MTSTYSPSMWDMLAQSQGQGGQGQMTPQQMMLLQAMMSGGGMPSMGMGMGQQMPQTQMGAGMMGPPQPQPQGRQFGGNSFNVFMQLSPEARQRFLRAMNGGMSMDPMPMQAPGAMTGVRG